MLYPKGIKAIANHSPKHNEILEGYFVYGQDGQLIGEYKANQQLTQEFISLHGIPVAVADKQGMSFVHSDHLGTPRLVSNSDQTVIWRWDGDAFGATKANSDVDGDGKELVMNLRFPGQYFDEETGFHYNYFRTYDPSTGSYVTSDPIGLADGLNTYKYANSNTQVYVDPIGLATQREIELAKDLLIEEFPNIFSREPNSITTGKIESLGETSWLTGDIIINSRVYGEMGVPVVLDIVSEFLQSIAHEMLHVNENMVQNLTTKPRMSNPILGGPHRYLDNAAREKYSDPIWKILNERIKADRQGMCIP